MYTGQYAIAIKGSNDGYAPGSYTVGVSGNTYAVPGPIAGAGLPALLALGGFVWSRRRKAAAVA